MLSFFVFVFVFFWVCVGVGVGVGRGKWEVGSGEWEWEWGVGVGSGKEGKKGLLEGRDGDDGREVEIAFERGGFFWLGGGKNDGWRRGMNGF